jgi:hypothetical protein
MTREETVVARETAKPRDEGQPDTGLTFQTPELVVLGDARMLTRAYGRRWQDGSFNPMRFHD